MPMNVEDVAKVEYETCRSMHDAVGDGEDFDMPEEAAVELVQYLVDVYHHSPAAANVALPAAAAYESLMRKHNPPGKKYRGFHDLASSERMDYFLFAGIVRGFHEADASFVSTNARKHGVPHTEHGKVVGA